MVRVDCFYMLADGAQLKVEGCTLQVYDPTTQSVHIDDSLKSEIINRKFEICLPSEAEWEKAARGPSTGSGDVREYPWEGEFNPNFANVSETGIGTTSALGCFPQGVSPYGLMETSGNVWEWMCSEYKDYPYRADDGREDLSKKDAPRTLRGGCFHYLSDGARCVSRVEGFPGSWSTVIGFRVVVSPVLPS